MSQYRAPLDDIRFFASARSAGTTLQWADGEVTVEDSEKSDFSGIDIALFSAGGTLSKEQAPRFAGAGAIVVDCESGRVRLGLATELADHLGAPLVWTTAALLGNHPMTAQQGRSVCELLGLGEDVAESLARQPSRGTPPEQMADDKARAELEAFIIGA